MKTICDDCKHMHCQRVCIGDTCYGNWIDDYDCDIEDWTEDDDIAMNDNRCRHYEKLGELE